MSNNKESFSPKQQEKWSAGVSAAKKALASRDTPIYIVDELPGLTIEPDIEAMGWNSISASEENSKRWSKIKNNQQ
jgi:hypothetical protein